MAITLRELESRTPALLKWGGSVELISAPGRGKSSFVKGAVRRLDAMEPGKWGLAIAFMGTYSPVDLNGFMVPKPNPEHGNRLESVFTMPTWARTTDGRTVWDYERGILFLDEFGQADPDVKKAAADLLLNKQLGPWKLPPGWVVWAASNRASDRSGVTKSLDFVINRRMEVHIQDDLASLERWMIDNGTHPLIIAFASQNPDVVFTEGVPDKQGPWMTPRSLVEAGNVLAAMAQDQERLIVDKAAGEFVSGLVGQGAAVKLMAFLKTYDLLPTFQEVVADPGRAKAPGKDRADAVMTVCYALAGKVDEKTIAPCVEYVRRLPAEFAVTFVKAACRRVPAIVNSKAMGDWLRTNQSLVAATVSLRD